VTGWEAYASVLAEQHARRLEDQLIAEIVSGPDGDSLLSNDHTTSGKSYLDAEMDKHKVFKPGRPSLNHRCTILNCTP